MIFRIRHKNGEYWSGSGWHTRHFAREFDGYLPQALYDLSGACVADLHSDGINPEKSKYYLHNCGGPVNIIATVEMDK